LKAGEGIKLGSLTDNLDGSYPGYLTSGLKKGRPLWHNGCANKQLSTNKRTALR